MANPLIRNVSVVENTCTTDCRDCLLVWLHLTKSKETLYRTRHSENHSQQRLRNPTHLRVRLHPLVKIDEHLRPGQMPTIITTPQPSKSGRGTIHNHVRLLKLAIIHSSSFGESFLAATNHNTTLLNEEIFWSLLDGPALAAIIIASNLWV